jgi:glycosyltransferase involved in cell wall biosynthesis/tetratricopeptide (TPR) repeat protein
MLDKANKFFRQGDYKQAIAIYKKCMDDRPDIKMYQVNLEMAMRRLSLQRYGDLELSRLSSSYIGENDNGVQARIQKSASKLRKTRLLSEKLFCLGFEDKALEELSEVYNKAKDYDLKALAARELAIWHMGIGEKHGFYTALDYINPVLETNKYLHIAGGLRTLSLLCHYFLGQESEGLRLYDEFKALGETDDNERIVRLAFLKSDKDRCYALNSIFSDYNIPEVKIDESLSGPLVKKLALSQSLAFGECGGKATVLIALNRYSKAQDLEITMTSLLKQTKKEMEILLICYGGEEGNTIATAFSAISDRFRIVQSEVARNKYEALNVGLDEAQGEYVIPVQVGDWCHPYMLELLSRHLNSSPEIVACRYQTVLIDSSLKVSKWIGHEYLLHADASSIILRREEVKSKLGYWDSVAYGGGEELLDRVKKVWGEGSVDELSSGPIVLKRACEVTAFRDHIHGGWRNLHGAIRQYHEAYSHYHKHAGDLKYTKFQHRSRIFPVPNSIRDENVRMKETGNHYDVIIASDFRLLGGSTISSAQEIQCQKSKGIKTAILPMFRYDFNHLDRGVLPDVWDQVDGKLVDILTHEDNVSCDLMIIRYPPVLRFYQRYMPKIAAKEVKVIVNQPPMSDYAEKGVVRYKLKECEENINKYFGLKSEWHPIGPLVRDALLQHHKHELTFVHLSETDWCNIIDLSDWKKSEEHKEKKSDRLRIGRHSRDHFVKWPSSKDDILNVYPDSPDVEVHILGGANAPLSIIGYKPRNWKVYDFGALHPKEFLSSIDVFVYFSHPEWVESFGRTIIEAMAVGVPVILPEIYKPLFGESAIYATPQEVSSAAKRLFDNRKEYDEQVSKAHDYIERMFGYDMHALRLKSAGVNVLDEVSG